MVGQNLFSIWFEEEEDLELILKAKPWFFQKQLINFDILHEPIERSKIKLVTSPLWLKVGPCLLECDKKDLMRAVGSAFGGILRFEIKGDFFSIKVMINV